MSGHGIRPSEVFVELSTITATDKIPQSSSGEVDDNNTTTDIKMDPDHQRHHIENFLSESKGVDQLKEQSGNNYDEEAGRTRAAGIQRRRKEAQKKDKEELEAFTRQI